MYKTYHYNYIEYFQQSGALFVSIQHIMIFVQVTLTKFGVYIPVGAPKTKHMTGTPTIDRH